MNRITKIAGAAICWNILWLFPLHAQQWQWQNPLPQGNTLYATRFVSAWTGFAVGDGGSILRTTDAGMTWQIPASGVTYQLTSIASPDPSLIFVAGDGGTILKSTDVGASWQLLNSGCAAWLFSISFGDANTGFAAGDGGVILKRRFSRLKMYPNFAII